jgi:hypothetical protein
MDNYQWVREKDSNHKYPGIELDGANQEESDRCHQQSPRYLKAQCTHAFGHQHDLDKMLS